MEEKERYKLESHNGTFCEFHDTETDEWYARKDLVTDLLNKQNKRIKELEQENLFLKEQNQSLIDEEDLISKKMQEVGFDNIEDLCNSQKQLAISKLEKVKEFCEKNRNSDEYNYVVQYEKDDSAFSNNYLYLKDYIDDQLKSLKGEK